MRQEHVSHDSSKGVSTWRFSLVEHKGLSEKTRIWFVVDMSDAVEQTVDSEYEQLIMAGALKALLHEEQVTHRPKSAEMSGVVHTKDGKPTSVEFMPLVEWYRQTGIRESGWGQKEDK